MRTSRKLLLAGIAAAVVIPVASEIVQAYRTTIVIPSLSGGNVTVATGRAEGLFATMIRPIYNLPGTFLTYFFPNETPSITAVAPEDAIIFTCPAGTNIPVAQAFSRFTDGRNQWLWGPYIGDEADRLATGSQPEQVFPLEKFMGRAAGFDFVLDNRSLVVPADDSDGALFFATADPPAGERYYVRCSVPATPVCGDGFKDGSEPCDNGAANSDTAADACRTTCAVASCGDAVVDNGEQCDDGNVTEGDGCSATCQTQQVVVNNCGNGQVDAGEACDDGDATAGDGCSDVCQVEGGYTCTGTPSSCDPVGSAGSAGSTGSAGSAVCGNGNIEGSEPCDDANGSYTDACLPSCTTNECGDGYVEVGQEACDDGKTCLGTDIYGNPVGDGRWCETNADCASQTGTTCAVHSRDGCSTSCVIENLYVCTLEVDKHSPTPERSYCAIAAPNLTSSVVGDSVPPSSTNSSVTQSYPSSGTASSGGASSGGGSAMSLDLVQ